MADAATLMISVGSYLPERVVTNEELAAFVDTSDEWIRQRTGIAQRHIVADGEKTSDLACHAARQALDRAGLEAGDIDLIIIATSTPDDTFPSTATKVQHLLGAHGAVAFDVQAVCAGFVYALDVADAMLTAGRGKRALVIGAESFSKILDWSDRSTCVLFGDGAGAVILERSEIRKGLAFWRQNSMPTARIATSSMWMAVRQARVTSAMSGWKATRCSVMLWTSFPA